MKRLALLLLLLGLSGCVNVRLNPSLGKGTRPAARLATAGAARR